MPISSPAGIPSRASAASRPTSPANGASAGARSRRSNCQALISLFWSTPNRCSSSTATASGRFRRRMGATMRVWTRATVAPISDARAASRSPAGRRMKVSSRHRTRPARNRRRRAKSAPRATSPWIRRRLACSICFQMGRGMELLGNVFGRAERGLSIKRILGEIVVHANGYDGLSPVGCAGLLFCGCGRRPRNRRASTPCAGLLPPPPGAATEKHGGHKETCAGRFFCGCGRRPRNRRAITLAQ